MVVAVVPECWSDEGLVGKKKNNNDMVAGYCIHVCQTDSCLYQDWFIPWLKKRKSKACENLSVMSIRMSHLYCNSSVPTCCSLWENIRG